MTNKSLKKKKMFMDQNIESKIKDFIINDRILDLKKYLNSFAKDFSLSILYFHTAKLLTQYNYLAEAEEFYRKILFNDPYDKFTIAGLGVLLSAQAGREDEALEYLLDAVKLDPKQSELNRIIGYIYSDKKKYFQAKRFYEKEFEILRKKSLEPNPQMIVQYGTACSQVGDINNAMEYHEKALKFFPNVIEFYGEMIFTLSHSEYFNDFMVNDIAKRCIQTSIYNHDFYEKHSQEIREITNKNDYLSSNKIKVGILSGSMHGNNAERFVSDIIEYLDYSKVDLYIYYTGNQYDFLTNKFERLSSSFKQLKHGEHLKNAQVIAEDGIHILLDTVGYMKGQNLTIFSFKPAPIQCLGYGYWGTSGLKEMDYIFLTNGCVSSELAESYCEEIIGLSAFYYNTLFKGLKILTPPNGRKGYITFGCQNRMQKVNKKVLALWAEILSRVENSKLLLTISDDSGNFAKNTHDFLSSCGIDSSRVLILNGYTGLSYLEIYNQIDIVLDPFPFSGGCTSFDALSMGKPIITYRYPSTVLGRITSDFLEEMSLSELIADSQEDYINKACDLASQAKRINYYHNIIPDKYKQSKFGSAQFCGEELQHKIEWMFRQKFGTLPWENNRYRTSS
ncbi:MAG: hypothetical protein HRT47_08150 [Candidatus Caenarcaniphilales bacterium]|nr:hypothetical protein [Candidatus Caenarcaniphilales bacterium]